MLVSFQPSFMEECCRLGLTRVRVSKVKSSLVEHALGGCAAPNSTPGGERRIAEGTSRGGRPRVISTVQEHSGRKPRVAAMVILSSRYQ